jgi:hypothetical protein
MIVCLLATFFACFCSALAFCNYTALQKKRRQILKLYTFPHTHSANWNSLDEICQLETSKLLEHLKNRKLNGNEEDLVDMKPLILMVSTLTG